MSDAGVLARVGFLIRRNRVEEAAQQLDFSRATMAEDPRFALLEAALYERQDRLLDARGVARLAAGDVAGAVADLAEASLDPTPERLHHLALAKAESKQVADACAIVQTLNQSGFDIIALRPTDRQRLEVLVDRLGLGKR